MSVSVPLWAYALLIGYSLVFSGLFAVVLAAREREKTDHENTRRRLSADRDYWLARYLRMRKEKKNDRASL